MDDHQLVTRWRQCLLEIPPYFFPGDDEILTEDFAYATTFESFEEFTISDSLSRKSQPRFHLGLLPVPYVGNLNRASVFIFMLNPGFRPIDYFAQQYVEEYRLAAIRNLRQENADDEYPFIFLDPRFSWHSGFEYWQSRFSDLIEAIRKSGKLHSSSYRSALRFLSQSVCCLELIPYHSRSLCFSKKLENLASVAAMRDYVQNILLPRAGSGTLIIVARGNRYWGLPTEEDSDKIVVYKGYETRYASLSLKSRGGKAIAKHLGL